MLPCRSLLHKPQHVQVEELLVTTDRPQDHKAAQGCNVEVHFVEQFARESQGVGPVEMRVLEPDHQQSEHTSKSDGLQLEIRVGVVERVKRKGQDRVGF